MPYKASTTRLSTQDAAVFDTRSAGLYAYWSRVGALPTSEDRRQILAIVNGQ